MIALFFILFVFGGPFLLAGYCVYCWSNVRVERYKAAREYLSRGLPVPPEILRGTAGSVVGGVPVATCDTRQSDLRFGINTVALGLAASALFYCFWPHDKTWGWGLVPMIIGLGYIVSALVVKSPTYSPGTPAQHPPAATPPPIPSSPLPPIPGSSPGGSPLPPVPAASIQNPPLTSPQP